MRRVIAAVMLVVAMAGLAACESVGASSVAPAERAGMVALPASPSPQAAADDTSSQPILESSSPEPPEAADASAAPTTDAPVSYPTVSTPPAWATDFNHIVDGIHTNERVVALTFDDGPTEHTRQIVDELDRAGDHATFFWVGSRVTTDAATYSLAHGEELANHTWSHPNMRHMSSAEASEEIGFTNARIAQVSGHTPVWFRSPFNRLYGAELAQIRAHGLLYANYNVTSVDWMKGVTTSDVLGKIDDTLRPGGVILMHDSPNHDPRFLPAVLKLLRRRGYRVVTMSELARMGSPVNEPLRLGVGGLGY